MNERYSDAFARAADLAAKDGVVPITQFRGCWERSLSDGWWIAINGHADEQMCDPPARYGGGILPTPVPPYTMYVEHDGTPIGLITPFDGIILSEGAEDRLIDALQAALDVPA